MRTSGVGTPPTRLRAGILYLLIAGLTGTGVELLLLGHTEDLAQLIPLGLIGVSLVALSGYGLGSALSLRIFQGTMLLMMGSGLLGVFLHYRSNVEFELESMPGMGGTELFKASMTGAIPALAPGAMVLIGGLGLLYTLGHPRLRGSQPTPEDT